MSHARGQDTFQLPVCFTDNMVLQRGRPVTIWGQAKSGSEIAVNFAGQTVKGRADRNGAWRLQLASMEANAKPQTLQIASSLDKKTLQFKNVLVGEVWLAGGQSNMAWFLRDHRDPEKYLPRKLQPLIRFLTIPITDFGEINRSKVNWAICGNNDGTKGFSAVAYFFAIALQEKLGVPVGIIGSYRGSSANELWMTRESMQNTPILANKLTEYDKEYRKYKNAAQYEEAYEAWKGRLKEWKAKGGWSYGPEPLAPLGPKAFQRPHGLYDCMIKPIQPYTIKGVIWYQGEANADWPEPFRALFPAFINGWRKTWENPDLPFFFVQLPGFKTETWPAFRQVQLECALSIPHCGMVVSEGCGDREDIHPKFKEPIGKRLAIAAGAELYGLPGPAYGPMIQSVARNGNKLVISFTHVGSGLVAKDGKLTSFEISANGSTFVKADAKIVGDKIEVTGEGVAQPLSVRYAYAPFPVMDLFNKEGLPASPFTITLKNGGATSMPGRAP